MILRILSSARSQSSQLWAKQKKYLSILQIHSNTLCYGCDSICHHWRVFSVPSSLWNKWNNKHYWNNLRSVHTNFGLVYFIVTYALVSNSVQVSLFKWANKDDQFEDSSARLSCRNSSFQVFVTNEYECVLSQVIDNHCMLFIEMTPLCKHETLSNLNQQLIVSTFHATNSYLEESQWFAYF